MGLFSGKKGMVFGIANDKSIAWAITQKLYEEGAEMGFTQRRLRKLVEPIGAKIIMPCDVSTDGDVDVAFAAAKETFGEIDFVIHSIAYAPMDDIKGPVYNCSRDGFKLSMDISCYSLIALANRAKDILQPGGNILAMTYLGGERVIPGYNIMGVCKAALECSIKYLASEMGSEKQIRVNGLSAGPVKTLAASAVSDHSLMDKLCTSTQDSTLWDHHRTINPPGRNNAFYGPSRQSLDYPKGRKISDAEMAEIKIKRNAFRW